MHVTSRRIKFLLSVLSVIVVIGQSSENVRAEEPTSPETEIQGQPREDTKDETPVVAAEPIVVTATRTERSLADIPVSVSVVTSKDLKDAPALGTDDIMRSVPGINLPFANSFTQHPTANIRQPTMSGCEAWVNSVR